MASFETDKLDYEKTLAYFTHLAEVRFKLLALLPLATFAAVVGLSASKSIQEARPAALAGAVLGFLATIGFIIYDQRNTIIYDRLVVRAKVLEVALGFRRITRPDRDGPINARPPRWPSDKFPLIWHDLALSVVYASCLAGWAFLIAYFNNVKHSLLPITPVAWFAVAGVALFMKARHNDGQNDPMLEAALKDLVPTDQPK